MLLVRASPYIVSTPLPAADKIADIHTSPRKLAPYVFHNNLSVLKHILKCYYISFWERKYDFHHHSREQLLEGSSSTSNLLRVNLLSW